MSSEPKFNKTDIAIIGMACRFPGADNYNTFWDNLEKGVNSIQEVPPERWDIDRYYSADPEKPNKSVSKWYGLIEDADRFDNRFFNIAPGEARCMDPQQRLLLEEAWHCIEDSGVALEDLRKKRTDVYVGTADWDYILNALASDVNIHTVLGNHSSLLANRISYMLGLNGASLTLDTACSSSLFAADKAWAALSSSSADYALVASACVHSHPLKYIAFSKAHIVSPDGQCKTFDKDANGFVLGDGVGVLLLQRLEDAVRGKKHIYGVIKGVATNHGGRGVTITSPRAEAQAAVLSAAYDRAGISPESISYIEAHGTGTLIGDPIELAALTQVFRKHTDKPHFCKIGSVKTNIGHTGGSAAMAGIIKVLTMMRAQKIAPSLNFNTPNPVIDFEDSPFEVATAASAWTGSGKQTALRAGVSAFGFGGANAHMVLEAPAPATGPKKAAHGQGLFILSAKSGESMAALLESWKAFAGGDGFRHLGLDDICRTLATGRESFEYRFGCMAGSHDELHGFLNAAPESFTPCHRPSLCLRIGEVAWDGWEDLAPLLKADAAFERELELVAAALEKKDAAKPKGLRRKKWTADRQLYRFMAGYAFLKSFLDTGSIVPDLLSGETKNSGLFAALVLSGSLSLDGALGLLTGKADGSRTQLRRPDIAFYDPVSRTPVTPLHFDAQYLQNLRDGLSIADEAADGYVAKARAMLDNQFTFRKYVAQWDAVLSAQGRSIRQIMADEAGLADQKSILSVIIADCIRRLNRKWDLSETPVDASPEFFEMVDLITDGAMSKEIAVALLSEAQPDFDAAAAALNGSHTRLDTGSCASLLKKQKLTEIADLSQWLKKAENTVACEPEAMLCFDFGRLNVFGTATDAVAADMGDANVVEATLLKLWLKGVEVNFRSLYPDGSFRKVPLPVYPFKGEPYWLSATGDHAPGISSDFGRGIRETRLHPLLHRNTSDLSEQRFSAVFTGEEFFLADHRVSGHKVLPGVAHLEMARSALAMAADVSQENPKAIELKNVVWLRPIVSEGEPVHVNIGLFPQENGEIGFEIYGGAGSREASVFSQGTAFLKPVDELPKADIGTLRAQCSRAVIPAAEHYGRFKDAGLDLGVSFRGIETLYVGDECALARLVLPAEAHPTLKGFGLHPGLLDSALQAASCLFDPSGAFELAIPFSLKSVEIYGGTEPPMWSLARRTGGGATHAVSDGKGPAGSRAFDVELYDGSGTLCARILHIAFRTPKLETGTETLMLRPHWKEEAAGGKGAEPEYLRHLVLVWGDIAEAELKGHLKDADVRSLSSDSEAVGDQFQDVATQVFEAIQAEVRIKVKSEAPAGKTLIQIVLPGSRAEEFPWKRGLSGLLKTARLENPWLVCQLIETDLTADKTGDRAMGNILRESGACPDDSVVRYEAGKRWVERIDEVEAGASAFAWREKCICLITGGLGGLGLIFAREISRKVKDATLILTGRSELTADRQALLRQLTESGVRVAYLQADVGKKEEVAGLIAHINKAYGRLTGLIHSAGVIADNFIVKKSVREFETVMAPKVTGLVNLDLATREQPLDFFVVFSSMAGSLGNIGQADYACANAFAGSYAAYRNGLAEKNLRQGRTVSIHWPLWKDGGMRVGPETEKMMRQTMGMTPMETAAGIDGFYRSIGTGFPHVMVIEGDAPEIRRKLVSSPSSIIAGREAGAPAASVTGEPPRETVGAELQDAVRMMLIDEVSRMMGRPKDTIDGKVALEKYGFDSISLTEFTNTLNAAYGLELAPTLFFEYPDVDSLSGYLAAEYGAAFAADLGGETKVKPAPQAPAPKPAEAAPKARRLRFAPAASVQSRDAAQPEPVAIVGISGRFPMAEDIEAFWGNLAEGRDCITEIPGDRWDWRTLNAGGDAARWGGFIDGVGEFDPSFFEISPREAELMDPQQRLMMLYAWKAIEDAGIAAGSLAGTKTGIFVGTGGNQYAEIIARANIPVEGYTSTGSVPSVGPNRMSYFLDIHGPSEPVETSCSSSLVALHRAVEAMASGSCDMALVGGVNTILTPGFHLSFGDAGMLSPDGKCKTFSDRADGYVRGEAVGMLLLKKLKDAKKSGDHIYGLIRGTAVNHGGRSGSLTTPNPKAQTEVLIQAHRRAGIDPATVGYIEAHGTGTKLGDPIEIDALKAAFKELAAISGASEVPVPRCGIGSVKSNIGHTELASGVAGVIKVLLQMQHRTIAKSLHCDTVNPYIRLEDSPFYIARETREWEAPTDTAGRVLPRRAGVSSFGFGGANAHVVIEEYIEEDSHIGGPTVRRAPAGPCIFVLSAKNESRLKAYAGEMADFLVRSGKTDADLADIAYTSQTGRDAMEERLGLVAGDLGEIVTALTGFAAGQDHIEGLFRGNAKRNRDTVFETDEELQEAAEKWMARGKFAKLLSFWVQGMAVDWTALYGEARPRHISLPTYPFSRDRYWIESGTGWTIGDTGGVAGDSSYDYWTVPAGEDWSDTAGSTDKPGPMGLLLFKPAWQEKPVDKEAELPAYGTRVIGLCDALTPRSGVVESAFGDARIVLLTSRAKLIERRFAQAAATFFERIRAAIRDAAKVEGRILVQAVVCPGKDVDHKVFSGLSGLLKTACLENPKISGQLIEIEDPDQVDAVLKENGRHPEDARIRYRGGKRLVESFEEILSLEKNGEAPDEPVVPWTDGGVYLITGGAGGLGLIFAREIAARVKDPVLILTGRSKPGAEIQARIDALEETGARAEFRPSDVTRKADIKKLIRGIASDFGGVNGIIHAAGITRDNFIINKTPEDFTTVLAPKVAGLVSLDEASADLDLDFFAAFSSGAGARGNPGQSDYACGNAFMDAYIKYRDGLVQAGRRNGKSLSVNWAPWKEGGMPVDLVAKSLKAEGAGMVVMETDTGVRAFYHALALETPVVMPIAGDFAAMRLYMGGARPGEDRKYPAEAGDAPVSDERLNGRTEQGLKRLFSETTRVRIADIDADDPFENFGIDSFMIARLNGKLEDLFPGVPKTLFYEYRTLRELTDYFIDAYPRECLRLAGLENGPAKAGPAGVPPAAPPPRPNGRVPALAASGPVARVAGGGARGKREPIAVIGISGRYPQADTLEKFWENLKGGKDCIREIPEDRWPLEGFFHPAPDIAAARGKSYCRWGGFIDGAADFDPLFFGISPKEGMAMDPQERLFLQACWEVFEDAGYTRSGVKESCDGRVGVFAGITKTGYELYGPELWRRGDSTHPNTSFSSLANRVSYLLDLKGPSFPIDTMCSSSLTAIHEACEHLYRGECDMAVAGGVNLYLHPSAYVRLCALRMLTTDNKNKSFGLGGDGFLPGEGVGAVLLKPLARALKDGDPVHALIRGTGINHGGRTSGYTIPNPVAQADLIRSVMEKAGVTPRDISYVEAHGTGTELGDPIEIAGLARAFGKEGTDACAIGSAKSNIGHLEAAAGIAGLTKIVLQMRHGQLAPSLHAQSLNPNIDFQGTPFAVQQELGEWSRPGTGRVPRMAGLSSFGAGGANAHIIIEEPPAGSRESAAETSGEPAIFLLSAKTGARLKAYAARMAEWAATISETGDSRPDLADVAFTSQLGREAMDVRIAMTAKSLAEIRDKLNRYVAGEDDIEGFSRGSVKGNKETAALFQTDEDLREVIRAWAAKGKFAKLLDFWVRGLAFDWHLLYGGRTEPRRISLPTYPFARERYWPVSNADREGDDIRPAGAPQTGSAESIPVLQQEAPSDLMTFEEYLEEAPLNGKIPPSDAKKPAGTLVCILGGKARREAVSASLKALAPETQVVFLTPDEAGSPKENGFSAVLKDHGCIDAVFYMAALEDAGETGEGSGIFSCIKAMAKAKLTDVRFLLAARLPEGPDRCYPEAWIGFERSIGIVMPRVEMGVVLGDAVGDMEPAAETANWMERLWRELQAEEIESAVYQGDKRHVYRIRPTRIPEGEIRITPDHTYLITGGAGGLGGVFARHLASTHPVNLILTGRSPMDGKTQALIREIEALNPDARVAYLQADTGDAAALKKGLADLTKRFGPIAGVIHAAGIQDPTAITEKNIEDFHATLHPKITGTRVLDEVLDQIQAGEPLDFICYVSSSAAILGDFGWCDYAVANRYLAAYADYKKARGTAVAPCVIHWPLWRAGGMGFGSKDSAKTYLASSGQRFLETDEALALFDRLLSPKGGQHLVLAGKPSQIYRSLGLEAVGSPADGAWTPAPAAAAKGRRPGMESLSLEGCVESDLQEHIGRILAIARDQFDQLDPDVNLTEFGFDSVSLTELGARLADFYGVEVTPAIFFEFNTIEKVRDYLIENHQEAVAGVYGEPAGDRGNASAAESGPPGLPRPGRFHSGEGILSSGIGEQARAKDLDSWLNRYPECVLMNGGPLNGGSDKKPCFWIHPLTGSVDPYLKIARNMDAGMPFFGIRSKGFGTDRGFLESLPGMAAHYLDIISGIDPEGPYQLAGFSMGGVLAYEMARQIQARGQRVLNLLLLEPPFPTGTAPAPSVERIALDPATITTTGNFFLYSHLNLLLDAKAGGALQGEALIEHIAQACREKGVRQPEEQIAGTIKNMCYAFAHNKKALASYTVQPLPHPGDAGVYYLAQPAAAGGDAEAEKIKSRENASGIRSSADDRQVLHRGTQKLLGEALTHTEEHYLKWKAELPGLNTVRLPLSSHFELLSDRKGINAIIEECRIIYENSPNRETGAATAAQGKSVSAMAVSGNYQTARIADSRPGREPEDTRLTPGVAIVGLSGRFPMAGDLDEFWRRLAQGEDCISEIPADRWDWREIYGDPLKPGNRTDVKWGGFMDTIADFDPVFFGIAPKEAEWMDPAQRLLMLYVWKAMEDAGTAAASIAGSRTGMFIGTGDSGYGSRICAGGQDLEGYFGTSVLPAMGPNRMSYFLDFNGPSEPVDTTCSSSLVAICKAVAAIESGDCEAAIAGGVNLIIDPAFHISLDRLGMLSKDGRCRTFSDRAGGYARGEGVGMLFLKPLDAAERDGNHIYGVIRGSAVNHGGRANSLTAPNPKAQVAVLKAAYEKAGIDPATVGYIEAHGTGTVLGDPIEIDALKTAFAALGQAGKTAGKVTGPGCGLGSVKTNIGHLELAAGVAGVIKVLLQLKHKTIVKSLHCDTLNPHIKLDGSPFYIAGESRPWTPCREGIPRRAGVSAFGAGGVNAHVVIEEYPEKGGTKAKTEKAGTQNTGAVSTASPAVFLLSARDEERLKAYALAMGEFFHSGLDKGTPVDLAAAAYTSQVGRDAMEERLALVVTSVADLGEKLKAFGTGGRSVKGMFRGNVKRDKETLALFTADEEFTALLDKWVRRGNTDKLISLWVKGLTFDWDSLYGEKRPCRISLPTYPFAEDRYWMNTARSEVAGIQDFRRDETAAGPVPAVSEDPTALMTFEEYLEAEEIKPASGMQIKTVLCILKDGDNRDAVEGALKKLAPDTGVGFILGGETYKKESRNQCVVPGTDGDSWTSALADIARDHGELDAVVYMAENPMDAESDILYILQAMAGAKMTGPVRFLMAARLPEGPAACHGDSWIGFERSLPMVMPKVAFGVILREIKGSPEEDEAGKADGTEDISAWMEILWQELCARRIESAVYKGGQRHVYRNRETEAEAAEGLDSLIKPGGTYLITGGCGGLGRRLARYLAETHGVSLILTGRSPLNEKVKTVLDEIRGDRRNLEVTYLQADICDAAAVKNGLTGPVSGVIHAAGVESRDDILNKGAADFKAVLRPKVEGTLALDKAMEGQSPDFVCYFSSASAVLGDFGACDYAVANRFMAAFARYRNGRTSNTKHVVFHWPLWKDGGMGFDFEGGAEIYLKSSGQRLLESREGFALFDRLLSSEKTQHLVLAGVPRRIRHFMGGAGAAPSPDAAAAVPLNRGRTGQMKGLSVAQCLESDLKTQIGSLLGVDPGRLDADTNLADFGFDSILFAKFADVLTRIYNTEITPSVFFGNPTVERLVDYFRQQHGSVVEAFYAEAEDDDGQPLVQAPAHRTDAVPLPKRRPPRFLPATQGTALSEDIAIIGMSGRFPEARNIDILWEVLREGRDAVSEIPLERFDWRRYYGSQRSRSGPEIVSNRCGILPGVDEFDPAFFEISPKEAGWMDPRQRLLLQESWKALEDAGYGPIQIGKNRMGVFVGMESGDYRSLSGGEKGITSDHEGVSAVRLAYFLNFSGPAMAINTACSSGLVAAHQACQSLRTGECDTAIAAGVNLMLTPGTFISVSKSGMLSPSGKCYAFDRRADGMVPGEAVVSVVLKRLTDAERDQDPIYAVIRGSGINYDGKTNGITAPNQNAQAELMRSVYDRYGIDPEKIAHIVTHGTGTRLGDSIEINALVDAFKGYTDKPGFCALTSAKTNFGHCFAASGLVSLAALVQSLRHGTIPRSLHFEQENDYIKWSESPFYVNTAPKPWAAGTDNRRLGAVSAFGMSGTNAHMVVESYTGRSRAGRVPADPCYLLVFSAKRKESLEEKIGEMAAFFSRNALGKADLARISLTLSERRHHFRHRTAVVVQDPDDALQVLNQLIAGENSPKIFHGEVPRGFRGQRAIRESAAKMLEEAAGQRDQKGTFRDILYGLAELYCQGYEVPLDGLVTPGEDAGLRLPTYPFARDRYWMPEGGKPGRAPEKASPPAAPVSSATAPGITLTPLAPAPPAPLPSKGDGTQLKTPITLADPAALPQGTGVPEAASGAEPPRVTLTSLPGAEPAATTEVPPPVAATPNPLPGNLISTLKQSLAQALYMDEGDIDPEMQFTEMGMDSIIGVEWIKAVNEAFGVVIEAIKIYDYPNLREFAEFLEGEMGAAAFAAPAPVKPLDDPTVYPSSGITLDPLPVADPGGNLEAPAAAPAAPMPGNLLVTLKQSLAEALYMDEGDIDPEMPFTEMGMDSIIGVEWIKAVNEAFGVVIEAIKIYDYPNLREFAEFLEGEMGAAAPAAPAPELPPIQPSAGITLEPLPEADPVADTEAPPPAAAPPKTVPGNLLATLTQSLAEALYMDEGDIDPEMPFTEMGMDSIIGVEWIKEVNEAFGVVIEAIKIYDYPNLREFAEFLEGEMGAAASAEESRPAEVEVAPSAVPPASLEALLQQVQMGALDVDQADALLQMLNGE